MAIPKQNNILEGMVAVVTGAANGNGRAITLRLIADGASVFASDIDGQALQNLMVEVVQTGGSIKTGIFDSAKVSDAEGLVDEAVSHYGRIDILVNNAGAIRAEPFPNVSEETCDWSTSINMKGLYFSMQRAAIHMMKQHSGTIINIASIAGIAGGMTLSPPYAASKSAVLNLTKVAASKLAEFGVTVNAVAPGIVNTAFNWQLDEQIGVGDMGLKPGEFLQDRSTGIPLGRISVPEDVSNVVAFLSGPDASYITGETIVVSGGMVMR